MGSEDPKYFDRFVSVVTPCLLNGHSEWANPFVTMGSEDSIFVLGRARLMVTMGSEDPKHFDHETPGIHAEREWLASQWVAKTPNTSTY
jgi:hypothetical protein